MSDPPSASGHGSVGERLALVERLLADPPDVHSMDASPDPPLGVWSTDPDCYRLIAERCAPGSRTLETGSGLSTALFAGLYTDHCCVTALQIEADRLLEYCSTRGLPTDRLTFKVGPSHDVLPTLSGELDLFLIDDGHGYPQPTIDWFYGGALLRAGGLLIIDDLPLPSVRSLLQFVDRDPRWIPVRRSEKWASYERSSSGPLAEDWIQQPFFVMPEPDLRAVTRRLVGRASRGLNGRLRRP